MGLGEFFSGLLHRDEQPKILPEWQAKAELRQSFEALATKRAQAIEALPHTKDKIIAKLILEIAQTLTSSAEEARSLVKNHPELRTVSVFGKNKYLGLNPTRLSPELIAFLDNPEIGIASFKYGITRALGPSSKNWDKGEPKPAIPPEEWEAAQRQRSKKKGKKGAPIPSPQIPEPNFSVPLAGEDEYLLGPAVQKMVEDFYKSESKIYRAIATRLVRPDEAVIALDKRFAKKDVNQKALRDILTEIPFGRVEQLYRAAVDLGKTRVVQAIEKTGVTGLQHTKVVISPEALVETAPPQDGAARVKKAEAEADLEIYEAIFYKLKPQNAAALLIRKSRDGELDEEKFATALFANKTPARAKSAILDIIDELWNQGETQLAESIAGFDYAEEPSLGEFLDDYIKQKKNTSPSSKPPAAPQGEPQPEPQPEQRHAPEPLSKQQEFYRTAVEQSPDVAVQILATKVASGKLDLNDLAAAIAHGHSVNEIETQVTDLAMAALAQNKKLLARTLLTDLDFAEHPEISEHLLKEYENLGGHRRFLVETPPENVTNTAPDVDQDVVDAEPHLEEEISVAEHDNFNKLLDEVADSFGESAPAASVTPQKTAIPSSQKKFDYKKFLAEERTKAVAEAATGAPVTEVRTPESTKATTEKRVDTLIAAPEKLVDLLESGELAEDALTAALSKKSINESTRLLQALILTAINTGREAVAEEIAEVVPVGRQDIRDINLIFLIGELQRAGKLSDPTLFLEKISDATLRTEARKRLYGGADTRDDSAERLERLAEKMSQNISAKEPSGKVEPAAPAPAGEKIDFDQIIEELHKPVEPEPRKERLEDIETVGITNAEKRDIAEREAEAAAKAKQDKAAEETYAAQKGTALARLEAAFSGGKKPSEASQAETTETANELENCKTIATFFIDCLKRYPNHLQALGVFRVYMGGNPNQLTVLFPPRGFRVPETAPVKLTGIFLKDKNNKRFVQEIKTIVGAKNYAEFVDSLPATVDSEGPDIEQAANTFLLEGQELGKFNPLLSYFESSLPIPTDKNKMLSIPLIIPELPRGIELKPGAEGTREILDCSYPDAPEYRLLVRYFTKKGEQPKLVIEVAGPKQLQFFVRTGGQMWSKSKRGPSEKPILIDLEQLGAFQVYLERFGKAIHQEIQAKNAAEQARLAEEKRTAQAAQREVDLRQAQETAVRTAERFAEEAVALFEKTGSEEKLAEFLTAESPYEFTKMADTDGNVKLAITGGPEPFNAAELETKLKTRLGDKFDAFLDALPTTEEYAATHREQQADQIIAALTAEVPELQRGKINEAEFKKALESLPTERRDDFILRNAHDIAQAKPRLLAELLPAITDEHIKQKVTEKVIGKLNFSQDRDWELARNLLDAFKQGGAEQEKSLRLLVAAMVKQHKRITPDDWYETFNLVTQLDPSNEGTTKIIKGFAEGLLKTNVSPRIQASVIGRIFQFLSAHEPAARDIMQTIVLPLTHSISGREVDAQARRLFEQTYGHPFEAARGPGRSEGGKSSRSGGRGERRDRAPRRPRPDDKKE